MKISCIIIDDEPLAIKKLEGFISKIPFLDLKSSFNEGQEAIEYLAKNKIELLFLDIQMNDITGIQLLESLSYQPITIFTTAYDQYAIQGFELGICDYLLKPFSYDRFLKSIHKALSISSKIATNKDESLNEYQFMFVKTEYRMQKIDFNNILYIEGMKDYLRIKTSDKNIMTIMTFKKIAALLPSQKFIRIHKSFIIPINKINSIERNRVLIGEKSIPIGDTYKTNFYNHLKGIGI